MSDKLINADKLMETIKNHHYLLIDKLNSTDYGMFTVGIQQAVDEQPTVDAELVVRCKDCKHRPSGSGANHDVEFPDEICPCQCEDYWYSWIPKDNFFCAWGEKRR